MFFSFYCILEQQKLYMKINFDQLFQTSQSKAIFPKHVFQHQSPPKKTDYAQPQLFSQHNHSEHFNQKKIININKDNLSLSSTMNLQDLNNTKSSIGSSELRYVKKLKMLTREGSIDRFYKPAPCNKKQCKEYKMIKRIQDIENKYEIKVPNKINRIEQQQHDHMDKSLDRCPTHIRLYNQALVKNSIRRSLEESQQQRGAQNHPSILQTKTSRAYLQKYVPFYDRLGVQIRKSIEKGKYFAKNPHLSSNEQKQFFELSLLPNKYRDKVQSRYKLSPYKDIQQRIQITNTLTNSLNSSFCNSEVSIDMIYQVEEHFFSKMKCIFIDESSLNVSITQNTISLLSELQFKILQRFIVDIQRNGMEKDDFQYRVRQYYYNLPIHERIELRNYERKKKNKKRGQKEESKIQKLDDRNITKAKSKQINSKYLKKIQYYV